MSASDAVNGATEHQLLRDYRLIAKLGQGGMGTVYKAHQLSLDRTVALKILPAQLARDEDFVARFYREARLCAKLDHPNIVRGLAVGQEQGVHYLAMELVEGESVAQLLARRRRLTVGEALKITLDVARALEYAHARGFVHRDIKPANVILTPEGVAKLADLGLAKITDDETTLSHAGATFGTPAYMAPEQMRNAKDAGPRSDLYALGAMLHHLVTGKKPFVAPTLLELLAAKERGDRRPASQDHAEVSAEIDRLIDRLLAPDPQRRIATAPEVITALDRILAGVASPAAKESRPPSTSADHRQPVGMQPRTKAALTVFFVAGVIFLVYFTWAARTQLERTGGQRAHAERMERGTAEQQIMSALETGSVAEARRRAREAARTYPTVAPLERMATELERGVLVLFQYATPSERKPLAPIWSLQTASLTSADDYRLAVVPSRDCYVYVFQVDDHAEVTRLFPNDGYSTEENPLRADDVHWIPRVHPTGSGWLYLDESVGAERIVVIALIRPFAAEEELTAVLRKAPSVSSKALEREVEALIQANAAAAAPCFADGAAAYLEFAHR